MPGGESKRKVTIEYGSDEASLQKALRDIEQLHQAILGLSGAQQSQRSAIGGIPPPPQPVQDPGQAAGWRPQTPIVTPPTPISGSGFNYGAAGVSAVSQAGSFSTAVFNNVSIVHITAQSVTLAGGAAAGGGAGGGGGATGGGGGPGGTPQAVDPGDPVASKGKRDGLWFRRSFPYWLMTELRGSGSDDFSSMIMGRFAQEAGVVAPWALPAVALHGFGKAATEGQLYLNRMVDTRANYGEAAIGGAFVDKSVRTRDALMMADANRPVVRSAMQSTGVWQALDFITGGTLSRQDAEVDRGIETATKRVDVEDKLEALGIYGSRSARRLGRQKLPTYKELMDQGMSPNEANNTMAALIASYNMPLVSAISNFAGAGYQGFADSKSVRGMFGANADINRILMRATLGSIGSAGAEARYAAMFGGDDAATQSALREGAITRFLQGDMSGDVQALLSQSGMSFSAQASLAKPLMLGREAAGIAGSAATSLSSMARRRTAQGAGGQEIGSYMMQGASELDSRAQALSQISNLIASTNASPELKAQAAAEAEAAAADAAEARKQGLLYPHMQAESIAGSRLGRAQVSITAQSYSGVAPWKNRGYGAASRAARKSIQEIQALINDPAAWETLTPAEKEQTLLQLEQAQLAPTEIARQQASDIYGTRNSQLGERRAGISTGVIQAQLFGTPSELYNARKRLIDTIEQEIKIEEEYQRAPHTAQELADSRRRVIDAQNRLLEQAEEARREKYAGIQAVTTYEQTAIASRASRTTITGGSLAAFGDTQSAIAKEHQLAANARQEAARVGLGSTEGKRLIAEAESRETNALQMQMQAGYSPSLGIQRAELMADTQLMVMTRTFSGFGDIRGAYESQLKSADRQMREWQKQKNQTIISMKAAGRPQEEIDAKMLEMDRQGAGILGKAVAAQAALEEGWQERLISEVYNAPSNFSIIASQFTRREASQFMGTANRYFGGNYGQMNYQRRKGMMALNSYAGMIGTQEGFAQTAMSGMGADEAAGGTVIIGGEIKITLQDSQGNKLAQTQEHVNKNNQGLTGSFKPNKGIMSG